MSHYCKLAAGRVYPDGCMMQCGECGAWEALHLQAEYEAKVAIPCGICGEPADGHSHIIQGMTTLPDQGTEKLLRDLLDRAYKMMQMAGYRVVEQDPDHNNPIIAWMADARSVLYGNTKPEPDHEP